MNRLQEFLVQPGKGLSRIAVFLYYTALILAGGYYALQMILAVTLNMPFNFFEPELVMDAYALSLGKEIYPSRLTGPFGGLYAPLYQLVGGALFTILPHSLLVLRGLSVLSVLGMTYIMWRVSPEQTRAQFAFVFAAIGSFHIALAYFDLHAKPDSFGVFLGLVSLYFIMTDKTMRGLVLSALFLFLSIATKQSMLFLLPAIVLTLWLHNRKKDALMYLLYSSAFTIVGGGLLYIITGPELLFYLFKQPGSFAMRWGGLTDNIWFGLGNFWVGLALFYFLHRFYKQLWSFSDTLLLLSVSLALPACVLTATKGGGLSNAFQPFFMLIIWVVVLNSSVGRILDLAKTSTFDHQRIIASSFITLFALAMLLTQSLNPIQQFTGHGFKFNAARSYASLIQDMKKESSVYCPMDNYLGLASGHPVIWSAKWELETRDKPHSETRPSFYSIALEHDVVVTIEYSNWNNLPHLTQLLEKSGYVKEKAYEMDQIRKYLVWRKASQTEAL